MNHQQPSRKRKTVHIKIPPKPAAPRYAESGARVIPSTQFTERSQKRHSPFLFPMVQVGVASILSMMVLDMGECSHVVAYAALGYAVGLVLMAPRRDALTPVDELLIRWGFAMLCVISLILSQVIWSLRGYAM
jgi:hypothetical protein